MAAGKTLVGGDGPAGHDAAHLVQLVRSFRGRRVVVVGDFVVDEFVHGDIARVSREAPVLILHHRRTEQLPGAAGNSVANLRALGAEPVPVGIIGRDDAGRTLRSVFRRRGIATGGLIVAPRYRTPTKSRVLAGGIHTRRQQIVRLDRGPEDDGWKAVAAKRVRAVLRDALRDADGLLIADYGYGVAAPDVLQATVARLRRQDRIVTVDSRSAVEQFHGLSACTPNQEELEQALDVGALDDRSVVDAGRRLLRRTGNRFVLLTRGAKGMLLFERRRAPYPIPPYGGDEVADVTGAGDTVIATLTLALIAGAEPRDAARLANYAAGIVVTKAGTATVRPKELLDAVRGDLP